MMVLENLCFSYDRASSPALHHLFMEVRPGSHTALIGPNGSGKTTLLRHLNGLLVPQNGSVLIDGMDTRNQRNLYRIRQKVGMVFQNPDHQIVGMTVSEDVAFGPGNLGLPSPVIGQRVTEALERVGMKHHAERDPQTLSSGEKQLVAIAGVLAMEPAYLVLDEPTAHLDPAGKKRVLQVMADLHRQGIALVHVTHDMNEAICADEVLVMDQGQIVFGGPPAMVFEQLDRLKELGLDIPPVADLLWRLRSFGAPIPLNIHTVDEALVALSDLLKKGGPRK